MRIDAHHHLWTLARGDYGWLTPALAPINRDFSLSDLAPHLAAADIKGTILVQAAPTEAETMFLLDIAAKAQVVWGVVGWTDFDAADGGARIDVLAARKLLARYFRSAVEPGIFFHGSARPPRCLARNSSALP